MKKLCSSVSLICFPSFPISELPLISNPRYGAEVSLDRWHPVEERWEPGEWFPSGAAWQLGKGRVFYFRPGHETFPIYHDANVQRIIANAIRWAAPSGGVYRGKGRNIAQPLSPIAAEHVVDESLHRAK